MKAVAVTFLALVGLAAAQSHRNHYLLQRTHIQDDAGQVSQSYSVSDGTHVVEQGVLKPTNNNTDYALVKSGSYRFLTPDGVTHQTDYTADENGYHAVSYSSDVPKPPVNSPTAHL